VPEPNAKTPESSTLTSSIPAKIPEKQKGLYREVLQVLEENRVPYAVAGAFALQQHTGICRDTKDLDLFLTAEHVPAALAQLREHGFECEICDPVWLAKAHRDDFFVDLLTTALEPGEILREIRISKPNGRSGQAYAKMHHPASGFAVVGVAANLSLDADGSCQKANIGITGVSSKAYRAASVEAGLNGSKLDEQTIASAASHATDGVDANGDLFASAEYRRHLAEVYVKRAIAGAMKSVPPA